MSNWYIGSTKYTAVAQWAALTSYSVGNLRRQLAAPTVGSERVFRCTTAGTSLASEPAWNLTAGATTTETVGPVWTEVTGQSTYGWTAPHARIANACASGWMSAGDTGYVSNNHAENPGSNVSITITFPGTTSAPNFLLCVVDTATPPTTMATTATVNSTGTASITLSSFADIDGISFSSGSSGSTSNIFVGTAGVAMSINFRNCKLALGGTAVASLIRLGAIESGNNGHAQQITLTNTTFAFGNTAQKINPYGRVFVRSCSLVGTVFPSFLFGTTTAMPVMIRLFGCDWSALSTGKSLIDATGDIAANVQLENCKLDAAVSVLSGSIPNAGGLELDLVNCDSASNNRRERYRYQGSSKTELTIVRSGGATDGTNQISRKVVTLSGATFGSPFEDFPVEFWNDATGSPITITIPVVTDNATLTNADAWIEVEYLGTSGSPQSSVGTCRVADFITTPANQPTDSTSTWTTTGLTTPIKQSLSVTITPQVKGLIKARVMVAKASVTLYYDPQILTSSKTYSIGSEGYINIGSSPIQRSYVF